MQIKGFGATPSNAEATTRPGCPVLANRD